MQSWRPWRVSALALGLVVAAPLAARAGLDDYLARPEPAYRWEQKSEKVVDGCQVRDLSLTSQTWQGRDWQHRLLLFRPLEATGAGGESRRQYPDFCTILNTGGNGGDKDIADGVKVANRTGAAFAILFNNPNQPLWGKTEDALVVHTWLEFAKSYAKDGKGDETWPLHHPMAKAVIKAMDAIQEAVRAPGKPDIKRFLVTGASKRGWTTWLVGASKDPRVVAIAPMVIDVLNVPKQTEHMIESWGRPSEQVKDYTLADVGALLGTPAGKRLMALEDPWSYRDRLTLPKLIINGTNDRYWTQDALNLYWDDLPGEKHVLYVPNSGHGLEDRGRVTDSLAAFARATARGEALPDLKWRYIERAGGDVTLELTCPARIVEGRLWQARATTLDFRDSKWQSGPIDAIDNIHRVDIERPKDGNLATFGEAVFELDGERFTLSSQIRILKAKKWY